MPDKPNAPDDEPNKSTPVPPRSRKGGGRPGGGRPGSPRPKQPSGRQARQATQRRNRNLAIAAVAIVVVVVVVVVIIGVSGGSSSGTPRQPASAAAVSKLENIPVSTLTQAVTKVGANNLNPAVTAKGGSTPGGTAAKPDLLYIGAEFCPICATERWAMVIALSKFGHFTNLQQTHSALQDGNIGTWSFYRSTYTSPYFTFTPVEVTTNQPSGNFYKSLETPTQAQQKLWYANTGQGSFPFIDFNGQAVLTTAQANPVTFEQKSFNDILSSIGSNNNTIGADTNAAAAIFMKHVCNMISNKAPVCSQVANVPATVAPASTGSSSSSSGG